MSARAALQRLLDEHGRSLTARIVLEDARDPSSELHDYFEWDDSVAAERFRLVQAAGLLRRYKVDRQTSSETTVKVRNFVHVGGDRGYMAIDDAMRDPGYRDVVLAEARRAVEQVTRKYGHLVDVAALFEAEARRVRRRKAA